MNDKDIELVKNSYSRIENSGHDYVEVFYATLFNDAPSTAALFKGDLEVQRKKLKTTIALVVKGLDRFESLKSAIFDLGKRHVDYGVHPDDFPDVVSALIKSFNTVLDDFTVEEEDSWINALNCIAEVMLEAWETPDLAKT